MEHDERTAGFIVAAVAPLACTVGITLWDLRWTGAGGHPYMLNVFKGTTMSSIFAVWTAAASAAGLGGCWSAEAVGWLILSSLIGIVIGDTLWLVALKFLGARDMILIDSLKPFMLALFAWRMLDEAILWPWWPGCLITTAAVGWVSLERSQQQAPSKRQPPAVPPPQQQRAQPAVEMLEVVLNADASAGASAAAASTSPAAASGGPAAPRRRKWPGIACAALNVLLDQLGAVITKKYASELYTWEINLVRFGFAAAFLLLPIGLRAVTTRLSAACGARLAALDKRVGRWHELPALGSRWAWAVVLFGCLSTTLACPIMTTWALFRIDASAYGVLTSTGPIYALPVCWLLKRERASPRAILGAVLAVLGIVVLSYKRELVELTDGVEAPAQNASLGALVRFCQEDAIQ